MWTGHPMRRRLLLQLLPTMLFAPASALTGGVALADPKGSFASWRARFRRKALAKDVSSAVFAQAFAGVSVNSQVLEKDSKQAEFSKTVWVYLESAASESRIKNGREKAAIHAKLMRRIEKRYGVDASILLAIWGIETAYGHTFGGFSVIEALATLAYDGRRRKWAEGQLITALKIIEAGDITPQRMRGSWAGAMGHTQFIPSSFSAYAVDFTGDGKRDIWSDNPADALASAANYLSKSGWKPGMPWGQEVKFPANFSLRYADPKIRREPDYWRNLGIKSADGSNLTAPAEGWIYAPAGTDGPGFLLFRNFMVIRRYNNADSYALAVGHLADRISGGGPIIGRWPEGAKKLDLSERKEVQKRLTQLGHDTRGIDGIIGPLTMRAAQSFQANIGIRANGFVSYELLGQLRKASGI